MTKRSESPIQPASPESHISKESSLSTVPVMRDSQGSSGLQTATGGEVHISKGRKWLLLLIFSISAYLDICGRSAVIVFVETMAGDLGIDYESSTWILNSYGVVFTSCLLLWGRVSDLYSAKSVFVLGFFGCAVTSLITSFMTSQVPFYVFRALYGVAASATVPSAFRLILVVFDESQVHTALAIFGLASALANATGLLWGGLFGEISTHVEQMVGWRWYMRFVTLVSIPAAILSLLLIPSKPGAYANTQRKWKYLDIVGSTLILGALLLLNVSLTLGASKGWGRAAFVVPFVLSWILAATFLFWETKLPEEKAILPPKIWRIRNMVLICFTTMYTLGYVAICQLVLVERFESVFGETAIHSAVRMLPAGLGTCVFLMLASPILKKMKNLRIPLTAGFLVCAASYIPIIYSDGRLGSAYWKYLFPALLIGSIGLSFAYLGCNVLVMTGVPASMSGIAGGLFLTCTQIGIITGYSIQAGLLTTHEGSVSNFKNIQISFWFQFGWGLLCAVLILVFFRQPEPTSVPSRGEDIAMEQRSSKEYP